MRSLLQLLTRVVALLLVLGATHAVPLLVEALEGDCAEDGCSDCAPTCTCPCCPLTVAVQFPPAAVPPGGQLPSRAFGEPALRLAEGVRSDVFRPPSA